DLLAARRAIGAGRLIGHVDQAVLSGGTRGAAGPVHPVADVGGHQHLGGVESAAAIEIEARFHLLATGSTVASGSFGRDVHTCVEAVGAVGTVGPVGPVGPVRAIRAVGTVGAGHAVAQVRGVCDFGSLQYAVGIGVQARFHLLATRRTVAA